jgi:hypothetical protein
MEPRSTKFQRGISEVACDKCTWIFKPRLKSDTTCYECLSADNEDGRINSKRLKTKKKYIVFNS